MLLQRRPISASDQIPDRFYVISMEFLSLSRRRSSARNVPSGEVRGENGCVRRLALALASASVFNQFWIRTALYPHAHAPDMHNKGRVFAT